MLVGYAQVSSDDENAQQQLAALRDVGCERIFTEAASEASGDRPELTAALDSMGKEDTLVVWRLDCLTDSMTQLIEIVETIEKRGVHLRSLNDAIDTTTSGGRLVFRVFGALANLGEKRGHSEGA
ncbi:MAG: recombinase family protein [Pseudomonadota bacterium]